MNSERSKLLATAKPEVVCPICAKKIPGTGNLSFHMALHPVDRPQVCEFCVGVFRSKDELTAHVKDIHEKDKRFICDKCDLSFCTGWRLSRHKKTHSSEKPYKCLYCDQPFRNYDNWRHHEILHKGKTDFKCDLCEVGFWNQDKFQEHQSLEKCAKEIKCCNQIFLKRLEYVEHAFDKHYKANQEAHSCTFCKKLFPYASSKKHHEAGCRSNAEFRKPESEGGSPSTIRIHRNEDGVYECNICDLQLKTLKGLKLHHTRQHELPEENNQKHYQCTMCSKRYRTITSLYCHRQTHFKKHACTICSKRFAHKFLLRNHMLTHDKNTRPFPCKLCDKAFVTKVQLMTHENCHTGFRPYKCRYCDNRFKRRTAWFHHELIHTGEKPYKCKICGVGFTQSSTCKSHEKAHEKVEGKRKYHCKECSAEFWSVTQLKDHRETAHNNGVGEKIQVMTEDGKTHWVLPNDVTADEEGNIFYYVSGT